MKRSGYGKTGYGRDMMNMKKANTFKCGKTIFLAALLFLGFLMLPANAEAAGKKVPVTVNKNAVVTIKSTKKIKWKSSKKKVLTLKKVSKKKVRLIAKKKGTAKVTITAGKKKYTCKVTVKSISGKKANVVVTVGGKKYTCKAAVEKSTPTVTPVPMPTPTPTPTPGGETGNEETSGATGSGSNSGTQTERSECLNADGTLKDGYECVCGDERQVVSTKSSCYDKIIGWVALEEAYAEGYTVDTWYGVLPHYLPVYKLIGIGSFYGYFDGKDCYSRVYDKYGNQVNDDDIYLKDGIGAVDGFFENLDGVTFEGYCSVGFPEYPHFRDVSVELINNEDEDGNLIYVTSFMGP